MSKLTFNLIMFLKDGQTSNSKKEKIKPKRYKEMTLID